MNLGAMVVASNEVIRTSGGMQKRRAAFGLFLSAFALAGCLQLGSAPPRSSSLPQATATSSSPDRLTSNYVALVHNYWIEYKKAEGDVPSLVQICGYFSSLSDVQPSVCRTRIAAMLPPHEKFLAALDATPAPPQFAPDDLAFRTQIPIAIAHLKATIVAAEAGHAQQVSNEVEAYVEAIVPLFPNLDHVDPSIPHD
jgi:hypothetical protein